MLAACGAATAAVMVVLGGAVLFRVGPIATGQAVREFATPAGGRAIVTLHDGTRLTLGPATRVRVPSDFGRTARTVELDGMALFAVVHDANRPLVVRTARATTRDLGTTFVVRAYPSDVEEHVAVAEGAVAIGSATLTARDIATVDGNGRLTVRHGADMDVAFAWTQGRLVFEDTPLRDVARDISRTFDLDVSVADSVLASETVTAAFGNAPLDEILDAVVRTVGARYARSGRRVVIERRGPAGRRSVPSPPPDFQTARASASRGE